MPYLLFFALLPRLITAGSVSKEQLDPVRRNSYPITPAVDESLLAIQIGGIVGAYVIFVALLLSLLLFVGRRLRRAVLSSNYSLHVEMMKPMKPPPSMDPSPVTPISINLPSPGPRSFSRSWSSLGKGPRSHASGTTTSVATIDESVVATDRQRAQEDLEMLYAAVMEHDAQKEAAAAARAAEKEIPSPDSIPTNPFADRSSHASSNNSPLSPRSSGRLSRISSLSLFNLKSQNQQQSNTAHQHGRSPSSSLPFRDAYPLQSAPATKLTVLERPLKHMNGPRTGVPTPYSPYMPFTPVTPLTPSSMITKRQRRRAEKESGLKVLNEDDMVRDDGDMWGY
nr:hypothetical protein ANI_1_2418014 [Aspergillus niger CBS 513.88]|eukprot:XP_003188551.1 hypothetical protein ANI_1_2418014 [Aspergillus niger CBS 513.88]